MVKTIKGSSRPAGKGNNNKSFKPIPSASKANAAGYAKRHSRKEQTLGSNSTDVYEYMPEKSRRSKVGLDLDRDEAAEFGVGLDGANEEEREALRARLIGENEDEEMIGSEDDEDIDSDAAFEESDEERYAGFFSNKKKAPTKKPTVHFADVDLNEGEDVKDSDQASDADNNDDDADDESGEDNEFIDLLDVLDGKGEVDMGSDGENTSKSLASRSAPVEADSDEEENFSGISSEDEADEEGSEEEKEDEAMVFAPSDSEDASPEALEELQSFISTLDPTSKKRKAPGDGDATHELTAGRSRKRRIFVKEQTEAGTENEFRAHAYGYKLNLDDLLAPLASQSSTLQSLKKSTKILGPSSTSKVKTLSAPLPQRTQERLDRVAAYEQTKEEVDKWSSTMKRIREAEHLSFPLQAQQTGRVSNLELAAKFKPTTALETSVDALLKSAKMRDEDLHHTEESMLKMNKLSVEEVAQRRGELRKMRELMFRAEIKARRVGKIKSKTYRKIKRKERERLGEKIDEDDEGSETEEGRLKREIERAKERATLRHKHTGKWARQMKHRELDGEGRKEIEEMLSRGEKLRRRIKGMGSDESEDDGEEENTDGDDLDVEGDVERIKQGAFDELKKIELQDGNVTFEAQDKKNKSLFEMKFMKDAMARSQLEANRATDDFIKEMGGQPNGTGDDSDAEQQEPQELDPSSGVIAHRAGGRIIYRPGATNGIRITAPPASDTSSVTLKSTDLLSPPPSPEQRRPTVPFPASDESNPWLIRDENDAIKAPKKSNEVVVGKDSKAAEKSKNKLKKEARKREEVREKAKDDAAVEISMDTVLSVPGPSSSSRQKDKKGEAKQPVQDAEDDSDANSEVEAQEKALDAKGKGKGKGKGKAKGPRAFEQRDLVALAFAGDNVVHEFEEAKKREIAADAPREVDTTIAGWGAWGGVGLRKAPPKPQRIKKIAGIDPTTRADYNKKHIIISEKRDKKASKYLVKDLPYPYTSKAQFERAMERPLGSEWNTRVGFQRGTLPKVVKKPGIIINPLEKLA
ncbi:Utp14 protein-domain-containing protein [Crucibulum laeve]|uniref:Utp14 protein-domain-containing protein n=1 Tax=Crucibulum laeve TaxID=68775 RepID=A0A5C3M476_9AGAR|nr:Utp14 protein-domain-containing protein [Crucibulum laeve]